MALGKNSSTELSLSPEAEEYIRNMSAVDVGLAAACCALTLVTMAVYINQLFYIIKYLGKWPLKLHVLFLLSIYTVYSSLTMVSLFVPRSIAINDMVSGLYISICLYVFVRFLAGNYGNTEMMVERLTGEPMRLNTLPLCCCCFCLPTITVSKKVTYILEGCVLQYSLLKPISVYVVTIMFAEQLGEFDEETVLSRGIIASLQTLLAMYGLQLLFRVSLVPLQHMPLRATFRCLQLVLLLDNIQASIFNILGSKNVIGAHNGLSPQANSYRIHRMVTVPEMLLLAIVAKIYYRRHMSQILKAAGTYHLPDPETPPVSNHKKQRSSSTSGIIAGDEMEATYEATSERRFSIQAMEATVGQAVAAMPSNEAILKNLKPLSNGQAMPVVQRQPKSRVDGYEMALRESNNNVNSGKSSNNDSVVFTLSGEILENH